MVVISINNEHVQQRSKIVGTVLIVSSTTRSSRSSRSSRVGLCQWSVYDTFNVHVQDPVFVEKCEIRNSHQHKFD